MLAFAGLRDLLVVITMICCRCMMGGFALTLGDVSGKGIPAAVMMASIQTLLRSLLQRESENLAAVLSELNRTLYMSSTAGALFDTVLWGLSLRIERC